MSPSSPEPSAATDVSLGAATRLDIEESRVSVVLVPLGSTEQHGPHLPLDTDTRIAVAIAEEAADQISGATVAPPLAYGASGEHAGFGGTVSIGTEALQLVLLELVRSIDWARVVVFVNGHGGNHRALITAVEHLTLEGHQVSGWVPRIEGGDAHAGETETSLLEVIAPNLIRRDLLAPGATEPLAELMPTMLTSGVMAVSESGVIGDPTTATVEHGQAILDHLVSDLVRFVAERL